MNSSYNAYQTRPFSAIPILLFANISMFIVNNWLPGQEGMLTASLSLNVQGIRHGELWRLVSYMFLHGDFMHILFNMWGLWMFGKPLENVIGANRFIQLYFLSGILGGAAWLGVEWQGQSQLIQLFADNPGIADKAMHYCVGASAGICGIVICTAMVYPNARVMLLFPPIPMTLKVMAIAFMMAEILLAASGVSDGIAHAAHIGGGAAGCLYLIFLSFRRPELYPVRDRMTTFWWRITKGRQLRQKLQTPVPPPIPFPVRPENDGHLPIPSATEIDRLLNKVDQLGANSLTPAEKAALVRYREQMRSRIN